MRPSKRSLAAATLAFATLVGASMAGVGLAHAAGKPIGAFSQARARIAEFQRLALYSDGRYRADFVGLDNRVSKLRGTYTIRKHGRGHLVRLQSSTIRNGLYVIPGRVDGTIEVKWSNSASWTQLHRIPKGWCAQSADCGLLNLPQPRCRGEWTCQRAACAFHCGR